MKIDNAGDARIDFDDLTQLFWVFERNFGCLKKIPGYNVRDQVQAVFQFGPTRDAYVWKPAVIKSTSPAYMVAFYGATKDLERRAEFIRAVAYRVGQGVRCRDKEGTWKDGVVTSLSPLKVKPNDVSGVSWNPRGHQWDEVEAL